MKCNFMPLRMALIASFFLIFNQFAHAQQPFTVYADGLTAPYGLEVDAQNRLIVAESGKGKNDGKVSYVNADGTRSTIVANLPTSYDSAEMAGIGAWHTQLFGNNQLSIISSNDMGGSVYTFDLNGFTAGTSAPKTTAMATRQLKVTDFLKTKGFDDSNPYSMAFDNNGNLFVADAAANSVVKFTPAPANTPSVVFTIPDYKNPTPVGPPFVNMVPTRIIARGDGGFYLATLTGFPFLPGAANIYKVESNGTYTVFAKGLTMLTDLAMDPTTKDLYALQYASFTLAPFPHFVENSSKVLRINADGSTQMVGQNFGLSAGMAIDSRGNIFVSEFNTGRILKFSHATQRATASFFLEDFSKGIPSTWSVADSSNSKATWVFCDTSCYKDYDMRYASAFYNYIKFLDDPLNGIGWSTFSNGSAALKAIHQKNLKSTLTSPAINCSGKSKVFLQFASVIWGGTPPDSVNATPNASTTCLVRVSSDGKTWKSFPFSNFNTRVGQPVFLDISEVAANQKTVYIQFQRLGEQNNQIWAVDDVQLSDKAPLQDFTVSVDMSNEKISPKGVYVAHDLNGWKPDAVKMSTKGGGMYTATLEVPQLTTIHYKFMNGNSWGENESVPEGCGIKNAAGYYDRGFTAYNANYDFAPVCFGACMACGNRKPQTVYQYCPKDGSVIYCENFENLKLGKLVPQVPNFTSGRIFYNGLTVGTTTDIANVVSYWNGYANYDGSKALNIAGLNYIDNGGDPLMYLADPKDGRYKFDVRVYVPSNGGGTITFEDTLSYGLTLDILPDSVTVANSFFTDDSGNTVFNRVGKTAVVKKDNWNDVSLVFDAKTKKETLQFNGVTLYDAVNSSQNGFYFAEFFSYSIKNNVDNFGGFLIDDIVYTRLPNTPTFAEPEKVALNYGTSPNPANELMTFTPDVKTKGNWQVNLLNTVGQVVYTQKGEGYTPLSIATTALNAGVYILTFDTDTDHYTNRITVQH